MTKPVSRNLIRGHHSELGDLFAAWADNVTHIEPLVRPSAFGAWLAPFPSREEAEQALIEAGAIIETAGHAR